MKKPQGFSALDRTAALTGGASSSMRVANAAGSFDWSKLTELFTAIGGLASGVMTGAGAIMQGKAYQDSLNAQNTSLSGSGWQMPVVQQKSNTGLWLMVGGGVLMLVLVLVLVLRRK